MEGLSCRSSCQRRFPTYFSMLAAFTTGIGVDIILPARQLQQSSSPSPQLHPLHAYSHTYACAQKERGKKGFVIPIPFQ